MESLRMLALVQPDYLQVALRVLHILAAIAAGGAVLFQWWAVAPTLRTLDDATRQRLGTALADRWRGVVFAAMGVLLVTGLVNFMVYQVPAYREHPQKMVYHGLFGLKVLAALAYFHAATVLVIPGPKGAAYRAKADGWLAYLTLLLLVIVAVAAVLRYFPNLLAAS
jgi:uncharacterized membrane protein